MTVTLHADLTRAGASDDLADTIDYVGIKKDILRVCEQTEFKLIERMAQRIAELSLQDRRVCQVDVVIQKPGALRYALCSEIELSRRPVRGHRTTGRRKRS